VVAVGKLMYCALPLGGVGGRPVEGRTVSASARLVFSRGLRNMVAHTYAAEDFTQ
jgi:hypothetical protein